jgi:dolichol-phosphate mannosyltransferase
VVHGQQPGGDRGVVKALVIVPTYNEADNVRELLPRILEQDPAIEVLVVDDKSTDGTGAIVEEIRAGEPRIHLLSRPGKMGLGTAYVDGFRYALERDYAYIFEMDADFSHDPDSLPAFLEAIRDADLVVGSRYLNGVTVVNWPLTRLILSYCANQYTRIITRMPIKDATGGFKCFRRETLERVDLDRVNTDGYGFQIEMNFKVWRKGMRLKEIPILFVDRRVGISKMNKKIVWEAMWLVWKLRVQDLLGRL